MRRWWLDEEAHAGPEHLDAGYVADYDGKAGFDPTDDIEVLRRHGLGPDSLVVDVSAAMTAALRTRIERLGLDNVTVVDAGFLSYVHEGEPADVVFTRNALHQIPDFWKAIALDRIASFMRPHGVLRLRDLVFDFAPREAEERIEAWMSGAVSDPAAGWTAQELAEHVRTEFSTYSWLLDSMLDRTGFDILERTFRRSAYGTYTCRRRGS
jgi:Methyltransferase domain